MDRRYFILIGLLLYCIFHLAQGYQRYHSPEFSETLPNGATVFVRYSMMPNEADCFDITWRTDRVRETYINELGQIGEGTVNLCNPTSHLKIVDTEGQTHFFDEHFVWKGIQRHFFLGIFPLLIWLITIFQPRAQIILALAGLVIAPLSFQTFQSAFADQLASVLDHSFGFAPLKFSLSQITTNYNFEAGNLILLVVLLTLIYWILIPKTARKLYLLGASLYYLSLEQGSFSFTIIILCLTLFTYGVTKPQQKIRLAFPSYEPNSLQTLQLAILGIFPLFLLFQLEFFSKHLLTVEEYASGIGILGFAGITAIYVPRLPHQSRKYLSQLLILSLLVLFIVFKLSDRLDLSLLGWIGFSYIAFRLLHILLDYQKGLSFEQNGLDYLLFVLFYPTLLVGPLDRLPQFSANPQLNLGDQQTGISRIIIGAGKKFILADIILAPYALNADNMIYYGIDLAWVQLYAFAFLIYFEFSGFIDMAIGSANLLGYAVPENFNAPYLQPNIAKFWQSWHITLSEWLRAYVFLPLSRRLLRSPLKKRRYLIILLAHLCTMGLIGLWHGITWNFAVWGIYHGLGLFLFRWISDHSQGWQNFVSQRPFLQRIMPVIHVVLTFHFVVFGWIFFALNDLQTSWQFIGYLLGRG